MKKISFKRNCRSSACASSQWTVASATASMGAEQRLVGSCGASKSVPALQKSIWGLQQRKGNTWRVYIITTCPGAEQVCGFSCLPIKFVAATVRSWGQLFPSPENRHLCNPYSQTRLLYKLFIMNASDS